MQFLTHPHTTPHPPPLITHPPIHPFNIHSSFLHLPSIHPPPTTHHPPFIPTHHPYIHPPIFLAINHSSIHHPSTQYLSIHRLIYHPPSVCSLPSIHPPIKPLPIPPSINSPTFIIHPPSIYPPSICLRLCPSPIHPLYQSIHPPTTNSFISLCPFYHSSIHQPLSIFLCTST